MHSESDEREFSSSEELELAMVDPVRCEDSLNEESCTRPATEKLWYVGEGGVDELMNLCAKHLMPNARRLRAEGMTLRHRHVG